jgi:hypothetical protein
MMKRERRRYVEPMFMVLTYFVLALTFAFAVGTFLSTERWI